jgi:hypothetical protein
MTQKVAQHAVAGGQCAQHLTRHEQCQRSEQGRPAWHPQREHRQHRRTGAPITIAIAYTEMSSPARGNETDSSVEISGSSPAMPNSLVPSTKTVPLITYTARGIRALSDRSVFNLGAAIPFRVSSN